MGDERIQSTQFLPNHCSVQKISGSLEWTCFLRADIHRPIHRMTDSNDKVISMLAGFRRHLVDKTLRNILH